MWLFFVYYLLIRCCSNDFDILILLFIFQIWLVNEQISTDLISGPTVKEKGKLFVHITSSKYMLLNTLHWCQHGLRRGKCDFFFSDHTTGTRAASIRDAFAGCSHTFPKALITSSNLQCSFTSPHCLYTEGWIEEEESLMCFDEIPGGKRGDCGAASRCPALWEWAGVSRNWICQTWAVWCAKRQNEIFD